MMQITSRSPYYPEYTADSILDIDYGLLLSHGITSIVFDLDDTLVRRNRNDISQEYITCIQMLTCQGVHVFIGTNSRRDLRPLLRILGADIAVVCPLKLSHKPFPSFYKRIITATKTKPEYVAMVGDHVINDVIGAKRAGLKTILVHPLNGNPTLLYRLYMQQMSRHASPITAC